MAAVSTWDWRANFRVKLEGLEFRGEESLQLHPISLRPRCVETPELPGCPDVRLPRRSMELELFIRSCASVVVGWPGLRVVEAARRRGDGVPQLAAPLAVLSRAAFPSPDWAITTSARFCEIRSDSWGTAAVFGVETRAAHRDASGGGFEQVERGELLLRDVDGAFVSLHLMEGGSGDPCVERERQAANSKASQFDVAWECGHTALAAP
jgi:hypothetical protein